MTNSIILDTIYYQKKTFRRSIIFWWYITCEIVLLTNLKCFKLYKGKDTLPQLCNLIYLA